MGNDEFSEFDSLPLPDPPSDYDSLLYDYSTSMGLVPTSIPSSPWTDRAFSEEYYSRFSYGGDMKKPTKKTLVRKYKPVDQKVRPVPTYFPDPRAQEFKEIPPAILLDLPTRPTSYKNLDFSGRVTLERLEGMLASIEPGTLTPKETDLLAFVVVHRGKAFAWNYAEKGYFSREYYPDYEIPTIEHIPWQANPIKIPNAIYDDVVAVIRDNEASGRFEPTTSSYRSSLFAVAKKPGSVPPV